MATAELSTKVCAPSSKLHAILVCFPTRGHVNPTLELALRLVDHGISITFVNFHHIISDLRNHQAAQTHLINLVGLPDGLPPDHERHPTMKEFFDAAQNMVGAMEQFVGKLVEDAVPISCIISDTFMPWTRRVALKFNIPRILLWTSSAATFSIFFHGHLLISNGAIPGPGEQGPAPSTEADKVVDYIPGVGRLGMKDIPYVIQRDWWPARFLLSHLQEIDEGELVLVHSSYELESEVFDGLKQVRSLLPIGPLLSEEKGGDEECLKWLDGQPSGSVLYIALGSVHEAAVHEVVSIAAALDMSQQAFIWALRGTALANVGHLQILQRIASHGRIVPWAPQRRVLGHPSVGGFLSHCGWNSTQESIWAGVPMIAWPRDSEQNTNSKYIVDRWRVGLCLTSHIDCNIVHSAIQTLMHSDVGARIKANMHELSARCSNATSSTSNLDGVIRSLLKPSFPSLHNPL